jgi:tetratricopeptide (TPR) repeat protein
MAMLSDLPELIGFFSYSREDDTDSYGRLSALRGRIQAELRGQLGRTTKTFRLWQDKEAIPSGTLWASEIKVAVSQAVFFIPIITPTVVASRHCRFELEAFIEREASLGRDDLIFPILYIDVPGLEDGITLQNDPILSLIASRQYVDWREFRFLDVDSTEVRREVGRFCTDIRNALRRRWVSPEELEQQEAARQNEQTERARQEEAARQKEQAERARQEEAARQNAQAERARQEEETSRQQEQTERARQEEVRQQTTEQQRTQEKAEQSPAPVAAAEAGRGEPPRSAEAPQKDIFTAVKRLLPEGIATADQKKKRLAAIVGSVLGMVVLAAIAVWLKTPSPVTDKRWQVEGWWTVSSGQCTTIGSFPQGWFYYYAKSEGRDWPGTTGDKSNTCVRSANFKREDPEGYKCSSDETMVAFNGKLISTSDAFTWTLESGANNAPASDNGPASSNPPAAGNVPADGLTQQEIDACVNRNDKFSPEEQINGCTESIRSGRWSGKDLAWAYGNRCIAYKDKAQYDRAMRDCDEAIALDQQNAHAYNTRGAIYYLTDKYDQAVKEYTKAIQYDPKFIDALHNRAMTYAAEGDFNTAIEDYNAALRIDPRDALALYKRGVAKQRIGDKSGGDADIAAAKKLDPHIAD